MPTLLPTPSRFTDRHAIPAPSEPGRRSYTEALIVFEPARLALNGWRLVSKRAEHPRTVVVIPGYGVGDGPTRPLRAYLGSLGHDAHGWGLGVNTGDPEAAVEKMLPRIAQLADDSGGQVAVVGWSLGGVIAREMARQSAEHVERVITLGTPVVGGAKYTALARTYRANGVDIEEMAAEVARRATLPADIPITAIYSRLDGVVSWPACIDQVNPQAEHIEVFTSHIGLGFNHGVWRVIADRLAQS